MKTPVRMLIWVPVAAAELQQVMHGANAGPAVLVPVESGTVLLFSRNARQLDAMGIAYKVSRLVGRPVVQVVWNEDAAVVYTVAGRVGRGWSWGRAEQMHRLQDEVNQYGPFGRWYQRAFGRFFDHRDRETWQTAQLKRFVEACPHLDSVAVAGLLREFGDGAGVVPKFLHALRLPDVAQVAELVERGWADARLETLVAPRFPRWVERTFIWASAVALILVFALDAPLWMLLVMLGLPLSYFGLAAAARSANVGRKPIDVVLPVMPVTRDAAPTD